MAQHVRPLRASGPTVGALFLLMVGLIAASGLMAFASPVQEIEPPVQEPTTIPQDTTAADTVSPTGTIQVAADQLVTNQTDITLLLQASDDQSGVDSMQFSVDGQTWLPSEPFSATKEWQLMGEDGVKTIYVRFRDKAGNWMEEPASVRVTLDRLPPQDLSVLINDGAELTNQLEIRLQLSAEGASQMRIAEDSSFAAATWVPMSETARYALSAGDGQKVVFVQFRDDAGNLSEIVSAAIVLDTTPPLNPSIVINDGARFTNQRDVQVGLSAEEAVEMKLGEGSLAVAEWQPVDTLVTFALKGPEGERNVVVSFRDRAGNATEPISATIILDLTPPQNPQVVLAEGREFVNNHQILASLGAEGAAEVILQGDLVTVDGDTGWVRYRNQITLQLTEDEGPKRIVVRYRDEAGNVSEAAEDEVILDLTPPAISGLEIVDLQPRQASLAWQTDEPTRTEATVIGETPEDQQSLVDSTFDTTHSLAPSGLQPGTRYRIQLQVTDRAGNSTAADELVLVTLSETVVQGRVVFPKTLIPVEAAIARLGELETESDLFGAFQFVHPPVGRLEFVVEKEGFESYQATLEIPKTGKLEETIELDSDIYTHTVSGTITDLRGNPLEGTRVVLFNPDGSESELVTASDDSGRYVLAGVPQGERRIRVFKDYFEPVEPVLEVTASMELDEALTASLISPPRTVAAVPRSIHSIGLEWEPMMYPTTLGYVIFRAPSPDSEYVAIHEGFLPPSQEAYIDSGLAIGTSYTYTMTVVNIDTAAGERSRPVTTATLDLFAPNQSLVLGLERQISHAAPTLADLDGDGDLDLLMAEGTGGVRGYRNIGSAAMPRWQPDDDLARGILRVGGNSRLALADLDGDGDMDLLRGIGDGRFRAYRNTGSSNIPRWKPDAELSDGMKEEGRNLSPAFADLDGDRDFDLMVGTYRPELVGYENLGGPDRPAWRLTDRFGEGLTPDANNPAPVFADLDGDGDFDLLIGEGLGRSIAFENIGTAEAPRWRPNRQFSTGISDVGDQAVPTLGDLDGDGDLDLLIGSWNGKVFGFENNTIASVRVLAGVKAQK